MKLEKSSEKFVTIKSVSKKRKTARKSRVKIWITKAILFGLSILFAIWFVQSEYPQFLIDKFLPFKLLGAFIAGFFYSSFLTTPIAVAGLYIIGINSSPFEVAVVAGLGAMCADFLLVRFLRNVFSEFSSIAHIPLFHELKKILKSLHLNLLAVILGLIFIALPLPDELGLILLGASRLSTFNLLILTFILNSIGIFILLSPLYLLK